MRCHICNYCDTTPDTEWYQTKPLFWIRDEDDKIVCSSCHVTLVMDTISFDQDPSLLSTDFDKI